MKEKASRVYTPQIRSKALINRLYRLKQSRKKPMTFLLKESLEQYLDKEESKYATTNNKNKSV